MKKYIFLALLALATAGFFFRASFGFLWLALLFTWVFFENSRRQSFHFLRQRGFRERVIKLSAEAAQAEISMSGSYAAFASSDQALSLCGMDGELWKRPLEPSSLAFLPMDDGACIVATADELVLINAAGQAVQRLAFEAPQYRQSYRLALSADQETLMLHTPWFLQFAAADLGRLKGRIACEDTGHYMKYAALSPDGKRAYFAGAKLLDEEQSTQARWGCWKAEGEAWQAAWAQAEDSYGNSHLRGLSLSQDGSTLVAELYREGYEFRVMDQEGKLLWKRAGEHPCLGPTGAFVLWQNPFEGLTLTELATQQKIWSYKNESQVRHAALGPGAESWILEGRQLFKLDAGGEKLWEAWFQNDPSRVCAPASGLSLALVGPRKGAVLRMPS